jgi:ABC-type lipoprotein export system ATPase subunit
VVTHDPVVAGYAHRVVRLHDGQIASDVTQMPTQVSA